MKRLLLVIILLLMPAIALAQSGIYNDPASCTGSTDWSNCDSVYASDDNRATNAGTNSEWFTVNNFSIAAPAGATITAVAIFTEGHGDGNPSQRRFSLQLTKDGSTGTGDIVADIQYNTADETTLNTGSTDSLWNVTLSVSDVNSTNFGVRILKQTGSSNALYVDHVKLAVWWTAAGTDNPQVIVVGRLDS